MSVVLPLAPHQLSAAEGYSAMKCKFPLFSDILRYLLLYGTLPSIYTFPLPLCHSLTAFYTPVAFYPSLLHHFNSPPHPTPHPTPPLQGDEYLCPLCRISITQRVVCELQAADLLGIFACPVTETVAKNYFDIIRRPMDLQTMATKSSR